MDKDVQKELGYFEKRMDMLKKRGQYRKICLG